MTASTITTYEGHQKLIKGHRRALKLRKVVRDLFDIKRRQNVHESFTAICGEVARELEITPTRVTQIMRKDFEYPLK